MNLLMINLLMSAISFLTPANDVSQTLQDKDSDRKPVIVFGLIADAQYCDCEPAGTRYYRQSLIKLKEASDTFRNEKVSFIINLGDLIDRNYNSYAQVISVLKKSDLKFYHVPGNHDYTDGDGNKASLPQMGNIPQGYYSFSTRSIRFIFLNGNEISTYSSGEEQRIAEAGRYLTELKGAGEINAMDWNGGMSAKQVAWFSDQLSESRKKNEKVLVFCHFPVAPENMHNLLNYKEILVTLEKYKNVIAWFSGHNHAGNYALINNIHHVTMKGMVETENTNSFSVISVFDDHILIEGFGNEISRTLNY